MLFHTVAEIGRYSRVELPAFFTDIDVPHGFKSQTKEARRIAPSLITYWLPGTDSNHQPSG